MQENTQPQKYNVNKMVDENMCLTDEIKHQYEFVKAGAGESTWKCRFCGFWYHEFEDSQP